MPIKIPKAFPRRKSSGNVLDELPNPPEPSFRVLERPSPTSFDGGQTQKRMSVGRPLSAGHLTGQYLGDGQGGPNSNRGSGGTNISAASSGRETYPASGRYSSSSTLPSSTDVTLDDRPPPISKDTRNLPAPPVPESAGYSIRAAGRAFSFGRKKADAQGIGSRPPLEHRDSEGSIPPAVRDRALTETSYASGSTATPPKLFDTGLGFEQSEPDNLGSIFENFGKRRSQLIDVGGAPGGIRTASPEQISSPHVQLSGPSDPASLSPAPLNVEHKGGSYPSPSSGTSQESRDDLLPSTSPMERTFSYERDPSEERLPNANIMPLDTSPRASGRNRDHQRLSQLPLGIDGHGAKTERYRDSDHVDDDARLVLDSIAASRKLDRYSASTNSDDEDNPATSLVPRQAASPSSYAARAPQRVPDNRPGPSVTFDSSDRDFTSSWQQESTDTTPRAQKSSLAHQEERSLFDASPDIRERKPLPTRPQLQAPAKPQTQNKIMTPAEFERYRREKEMKSGEDLRAKPDDSDEEEDDYEDEDEVEQAKEAARQRRKQEAHMSVYRQQMMKMTGEQPSSLPSLRPGMDAVSSRRPQSGLNIPEFSFDRPSESGKTSDEDEDDDVPLGVLAAHGFPSKSRPPSMAAGSSSKIQYKSESYPPPPASTNGASGVGRRSLPPFARHLPQDPYFGASLVNPSDRQVLAFGHQGPKSIHGGTSPGAPPGPPGGLVGVINAEEQARAARRGSPNAQGAYSSPLPQGMLPGMPPMITPGEQQMSEQMNQMMQMQMQFMHQMQQMMGGGPMPMGMLPPGQQMPSMPGMQQMPNMPPQPQPWMGHPGMAGPGMPVLPPPGQGPRPMSAGFPSASSASPGQGYQQRAMSMMGSGPNPPWKATARQSTVPSMMSGALEASSGGHGYTPSIAPSERSNVGMPSRYRPVSIMVNEEPQAPRAHSRASTMGSGSLMPGGPGGDHRLSAASGSRAQSRLSSLRPVSTSPQPPKKGASDDDDEEGWEEMRRKRDEKKSKWRLNRGRETKPEAEYEVYDYPEE